MSGAFSKPEDLIGRAVIYPIEEHQPILDHEVAAAGSGIGLTVKIPEGMRAVSVRSNDVVGVAGFPLPRLARGCARDFEGWELLETPRLKPSFPMSRCLLPDRRSSLILAGKPETVNVVTLLLKPEDGEKLVLAASQGTIQFVLRNGADQNSPGTRPVNMTDLMTGPVKSCSGREEGNGESAKPSDVEPSSCTRLKPSQAERSQLISLSNY